MLPQGNHKKGIIMTIFCVLGIVGLAVVSVLGFACFMLDRARRAIDELKIDIGPL